METNTTNNEVNETINSTEGIETEANAESNKEPEGITYSESEVAARVQKAVDLALKKAREKSTKTNDELTMELNALKAQLAAKENTAYVASQVNKLGLPAELSELFYAEDEDTSKSKINAFSKWYKNAIDSAVEARLNATQPPHFGVSTPGASSQKQPVTTFSQFLQRENK